jgi:curved DNA-binding protein CbpA
VAHPKTFRIERGIGQYDFNDYYAVLGLPLTAPASHVRKRYLSIAKCLHPDVHGRTDEEKLIATQYLSKLVNPAYDVLSQERERTEYYAILKLLGKRLMKRNQRFEPQSEIAKQLLLSAQAANYEQSINEIAKIQYQNLTEAIENIGLLSELNLVYILLQEGYRHSGEVISYNSRSNAGLNTGGGSQVSRDLNSDDTAINGNAKNGVDRKDSKGYGLNSNGDRTAGDTGTTKSNSYGSSYQGGYQGSYQMRSDNGSKPKDTGAGRVSSGALDNYIRQAESYIQQQLWASALKELRAAIQIDCNNSKCHALLGFVYLNQKLAGMAKVSFQQALKLNPNEPLALQYIDQVSGTMPNVAGNRQAKSKDDKGKKGGFFGWLGGG